LGPAGVAGGFSEVFGVCVLGGVFGWSDHAGVLHQRDAPSVPTAWCLEEALEGFSRRGCNRGLKDRIFGLFCRFLFFSDRSGAFRRGGGVAEFFFIGCVL